jgi:hypothetical protein
MPVIVYTTGSPMTDTSSPCSAVLGDAILSAPNKGQQARLLGCRWGDGSRVMSYVVVAPEMVAEAAGNLAGIGSVISEANAAAAVSTTQVLPAAADEVSGAISAAAAAPPAGRQGGSGGLGGNNGTGGGGQNEPVENGGNGESGASGGRGGFGAQGSNPGGNAGTPPTAAAAGPALTAKVPAAPGEQPLTPTNTGGDGRGWLRRGKEKGWCVKQTLCFYLGTMQVATAAFFYMWFLDPSQRPLSWS